MSIHKLLMRLLSAFRGGKALSGNAKRVVFDLTFDLTQEVVNGQKKNSGSHGQM